MQNICTLEFSKDGKLQLVRPNIKETKSVRRVYVSNSTSDKSLLTFELSDGERVTIGFKVN